MMKNLKNFESMRNLRLLVKSYEFIYFSCILVYMTVILILLGFGVYYHINDTPPTPNIPVVDASSIKEDLTIATAIVKESTVLAQEELPAVIDPAMLPDDKGWLD